MPFVEALIFLTSVGILFCWVIEVLMAFRHGGTLTGVLSIILGIPGGFVIGWLNVNYWEIRSLMIIWSCLLGLAMILVILFPSTFEEARVSLLTLRMV